MIRKLFVKSNEQSRQLWQNLLLQEGIKSENNIDQTFGYFDDGKLVATASRYQNVIKCVAVDASYSGGSVFNELITHVLNENVQQGYFKHYLYTKPSSAQSFVYLGFKPIQQIDDSLVFMEKATSGFDTYLQKLEKERIEGTNIAAIVMNANPFTLGHQYLVTQASDENDVVHVFVLSEEMSPFTSSIRKELVKQGVQHLHNVKVHSTENYMVSNATFPSYFLKESDDVTSIQARLDAKLFVDKIAPALGITRRYVGNEPFSNATNLYNEAMKKEFDNKIELIVLDRKQNHQSIISASQVRKLLIDDQWDHLKDYIPLTTYEFLISQTGQEVIKQLKEFHHEHP